MRVLLSHPFSGALYAFFATHQEGRLSGHPTPRHPHPYYRTLYGDAFPQYQQMALTLAILFDELIIVPADTYLPGDYWQADQTYHHPTLGLRTEWDFHVHRQLDVVALEDLRDPVIARVLQRVPVPARQQIVRDVRHEVYLANKYNCPIVCAGGRRKIVERVLRLDTGGTGLFPDPQLSMAEHYVSLVGPIFEPSDTDTLIDLKADGEIRGYARAFTSAMERFDKSVDVEVDLENALREAIDSARFAGRLAGMFQVTSTVMSLFGLVPVLGTATSIAGLGADAAARWAESRQRSQSWYELAGQIRRVSSVKNLERQLDKGRTGSTGPKGTA